MKVQIQQKIIKRKSYRIIIIGILLFQCTIILVSADPLQGRWGHASALINNRIYVYGGRTDQTVPPPTDLTPNINELIYLDLSNSFNPVDPPWVVENSSLPLENGNSVSPPSLAFHSCSFGGDQNELLTLFGGQSKTQDPPIEPIDNSLFIYNTTTKTWLTPSLIINSPSNRILHTMETSLSDSISYLWGGTPAADDANALNVYKLTITDTISWELLSSAPVGRLDHSATLLDDGKMYIIGGLTDDALAPMENILIYDTNTDVWTSQTVTGNIPDPRRAHRTVGIKDKIIIYGGTTVDFNVKFDDVAVLNVTALIWTKPTIIGTTPPGRFAHSMTLVGSKAIVTFGFVDDFTGRNMFVLDTDSYTWETMYNVPVATTGDNKPNETTNSSGYNNNSSSKNSGVIIGASVGASIIFLLLVGLLFFWIRRRNKPPSFSATPYEKQQASIPPIAGPAPLHNLNNYGSSSPSQGGASATPFIPPFAASRRQGSFGSISETRNLTPVDQHDSWGSAPSNSSQSQLPQINTNIYHNEYSPTTPKPTSPHLISSSYLSPPTPPPQHHSNTPPTPPASTPTPPSVLPQNPTNTAAGASSSTKTSSSNLRLDSDSNTAPAGFDFNLPPVAPLSFNRTRTPSPQAQAQQQLTTSRLPISTTSSSSSLPQDSSNVLVSSPTEIEPTETITTSTEDEGETSGSFNSPLFRTEALSALAGTAAFASPADRTLSLRSVPRINTQTPRNSTGLSSPPPISAGGRLRSSTLDGQHTYDGNVTGGSRPTSPLDNNTSDNQTPRGRLFVANPDPSDDSD